MGLVRGPKTKGLQSGNRSQALKARGSVKMKSKRKGSRKIPDSTQKKALASTLGLQAVQGLIREKGRTQKRMIRRSFVESGRQGKEVEEEEEQQGEEEEVEEKEEEEKEDELAEGEEKDEGMVIEGEEEDEEEEVEDGEETNEQQREKEEGEEEEQLESKSPNEEDDDDEEEESKKRPERATEAHSYGDSRDRDSNDGEADGDILSGPRLEGTAVSALGTGNQKKSKAVAVPGKKKHHKTGVCYLSRIPPHMKPLKLRHLLSQFAAIGRIYLAPEDAAIRQRRKQAGGNTGKNFTEGWVEFERKRDAKQVAGMLNGEPMGGGHRSAYRWDLWNIKYLHGFKWDNLTEEIAYRNAVREQKLATELRAAAKERDFYLQQVNKSKGLKAMAEKRKKRGEVDAPGGGEDPFAKIRRTFVQRDAVRDAGAQATPLLSKDVLSKVFN